jgi:beta-mannosidase
MRIGLRTLELRQADDKWGKSFAFVVNGVPIFCKGANWIPADQFPARVTEDQYKDLIGSAASAHMNMLRVWGGGIYEDDLFYDLCDEHGILIWQDFMFACAHYPADDAFIENVRLEAVDNVRRIRHHASLALWCGNNEIEWFLVRGSELIGGEKRKEEFVDLFYKILPGIVAAENSDTSYWSSSPSSGAPFEDPNSSRAGDGHYWDVWHGAALFTSYRDQYFRFMSEFGFQSLPSLRTIASFAEAKDWNIASYDMEVHQKSCVGSGHIVNDMMKVQRLPSSFPMLVYASQVLQAEAIRYGVEHWRRNRNDNRCMGTLYWQLNDCWPVASWSSIEYNHSWKGLHYAAKRFYAPVLLSAVEDGAKVELHITNDRPKSVTGKVRWMLENLNGRKIVEGEVDVEVPPMSDACVANLDFSDKVDGAAMREVVFIYSLWKGNHRLSLAIAPFVPNKYLDLQDPGIHHEVEEDDNGRMQVMLAAHQTARFVMLEVPMHNVRFSDNFLDLPAGRLVYVRIDNADGLTAQEIDSKLRVVSLWDSYNK